MSGIYIKGMEMPKSCWHCRFELNNMCRATINRMRVESCDRHPDCPLVEVPKHGRLIDADSVEKQIDYVANLDWNRKVGASGGMFAALEIVEDALTIIESEE